MSRRKRQEWSVGDVFTVQQPDGQWSIGQVLDVMMPNVVTCAFYNLRGAADAIPTAPTTLPFERLISVASVTREALDGGDWKVVGHLEPAVDRGYWPNEPFRPSRWIGATVYDASILEEFLDAYHGLVAWDDWHDPNYLDRLLIVPDRKPANLVYKHAPPAAPPVG